MGVAGGAHLGNGRETRQDGAPGSKDAPPPGGSSGSGSNMTRREAADYIAGMLDGLKSIAHKAGLSFVAYLLAMAIEEARAEKSREDRAEVTPPSR
jgi:hypothetical protein